MKKLLIILLAFISLNAAAQPWQTIRGNGEIKRETRTISDFTSLSSRGSMDVQISYGSSNKIEVQADENLLPYIETVVEDGKLLIGSKKNVNFKTTTKMVIYVTMNTMKSLQLSGSGNIEGSGAFTNDDKSDIGVSGSGNIKLHFKTFKALELAVAGSGNIDLEGDNATDNISAAISGSGNIDCADFVTNNVDAKISGSGNLKVNVNHSIDAKISGSGNVFYRGDASNISSRSSGSGKVVKM